MVFFKLITALNWKSQSTYHFCGLYFKTIATPASNSYLEEVQCMDFLSCRGSKKEKLEQIYTMFSERKAFMQLQTNLI